MNPVTNTLSNANAAQSRNPASSADANRGAEFANLFSSLSAQSPQPQQPSAAPTRAPNKPAQAQANGKPQASQDQPAVKDPAQDDAAQAAQSTQTNAPAQAKDDSKADEQDPAQAKSDTPATVDPAAQLLAMTQQAQALVQGKASAAGEAREGAGELPGAARAHGRGLQKPDALAAATRGEEAVDTAATHEAADARFVDHIADALALRAAKTPQGEDALAQLQSRQDTPATTATPQALASATVNTAQTQNVARAASAASDQLAPRVGAAGWDRALGQKVVWMVGQGEQSASLTLNPPDLGPLQVVLTVSHTQASADFSAAQPEVRQALQDALPRLREMLADAGISLGQANVHAGAGDHAQHAQQGSGAQGGSGGTGRGADNSTTQNSAVESHASAPIRQGVGLVNTFA